MHEYTEADLARLFHVSGRLLQSLAGAGYIAASADEGRTGYSTDDLLILRTASALKKADIAESKIIVALGHLRTSMPRADKDPPSLTPAKRSAVAASGGVAPPAALRAAQAHYARGHALEESDVTAARDAYLNALAAHGDHLDARINLGRLLHLNGELEEAEKVYRQARTSSALLSFNLGILLEDLDREDEAVAAYRDALAQDPALHDAHFNLSRLHERAQRPRDALRHLLAFRRHLQKYGDSSPS